MEKTKKLPDDNAKIEAMEYKLVNIDAYLKKNISQKNRVAYTYLRALVAQELETAKQAQKDFDTILDQLSSQAPAATTPPVQASNGNTCKAPDIALSNGQVWSACNVGATTPQEYGNYYQW